MNALAISGLTIIITCFPLSLLILLRSERRSLHRLWAVFNIAVGVWGIGTCGVGLSRTAEASLWWWKVAHLGGIFLGVIFFHLVTRFCRLQRRALIIGAYLYAAIFSAVVIAGIAVSSPRLLFGSLYYNTTNPLHASLIAIWVAIVAMTHFDLIKALRSATGYTRQQIKYFLTGMAVGFTGGTTVLIPMFYVPIYPLGNFSIPLYCLIVTYAIVRYRLLDINLAITRTAVFIAVYACVLGLPLLGALVWEMQLEQLLGRRWWVWLWVGGVLLTSLAQYVNLYFQQRAEAWLQKEQRQYQSALQTMSQELIGFADVASLQGFVGKYVAEQMGLASAELLVHGNGLGTSHAVGDDIPGGLKEVLERWMTSPSRTEAYILVEELEAGRSDTELRAAVRPWMTHKGYALLMPGWLRGELVSCLVLGPKQTKEIFTPEDFEVLQALARQSSLVIKNIVFHEEAAKQRRLAQFGQLMNEITHEFGNVFTIIAGTLQLMVEQPQDPGKLKQSVTSLQEDIRRGQYLTKAAWTYQKKYATPVQAWPLAQVLQGVLTEAQHEQFAAADPQLTVITELPPELSVEGTANLHELLLNCLRCLGWACEHEPGTVTITASQAGDRIQLRLLLAGGTDLAAQTSFHPDSVAPQPGRHGGLYFFLASLIISDHGGRLAIEPQSGGKTLLLLELPRQQSQQVAVVAGAADSSG